MSIRKLFAKTSFKFAALVALVLLVGASAWSARLAATAFDPASVVVAITANQPDATFASSTVETAPFTAWYVGFRPEGEGHAAVTARFRVTDTREWSAWQSVDFDDTEDLDQSGRYSGYLLTPTADAYEFRLMLTGAVGYSVHGLAIDTPDTRPSAFETLKKILLPSATAQLSDLHIIPRGEWGANADYLLPQPKKDTNTDRQPEDERQPTTREKWCAQIQKDAPEEFVNDGRYLTTDDAGRTLAWPRTYSKEIKKFIVHHTAGEAKDLNGDGVFDTKDGEAIARGIYYHHAIFNGWGDIGYNYLIDPTGNVYEGRSGGEGVVAAHAYCANTGTIGIAFIGEYSDTLPPAAQVDAAIALIGELANIYKLDPAGSSRWHDKDTGNVVGHRDYGYTSCPGRVEELLPDIRTRASLYAATHRNSELTLDLRVAATTSPLALNPLADGVAIFTLTNIGKQAWPTGTRFLISPGDALRNSGGATLTTKGYEIARLSSDVLAGANYTLSVPITAGAKGGRYRFTITPTTTDGGEFTRFSVEAIVASPTLDYEVVKAKHPPWPFYSGQTATAWIELRNKSSVTWKAVGPYRAYLATVRPTGRVSPFTGSDVLGTLDIDTPPGGIGHFTMTFTAPDTPSRYTESFAPAITGMGIMPDYGMFYDVITREPRFAATVTSKSAGSELRFAPGETKTLYVDLKNKSPLTWTTGKLNFEVVKNSGITFDATSVTLTGEVAPETVGRVMFRATAPMTGGRLILSLKPRWGSGTKGATADQIDFALDVASATLTARLAAAPARVYLPLNQTAEITIQYKNTGNLTWYPRGERATKLGTYLPENRVSESATPTWLSTSRAAFLKENEVKPGEIGTFTFTITKKRTGRIDESFAPFIESVGWAANEPVTFAVLDGETVKVESREITGVSAATGTAVSNDTQAKAIAAAQTVTPAVTTPTSNVATSASTTSTTSIVVATTTIAEPKVRIRLGFASDRVEIGGGSLVLTDGAGHALFSGSFVDFEKATLQSSDVYRVEPTGDTILTITNWQHTPSWTNTINDNRYRGVLEVRLVDGQLTVINELPLESYIRGIAEPLPTDPPEKAKLLAILARSYALYYVDSAHRKYPGKPYDGSDNPAEFQKYLGYNYELRGNMPKAAEETRGLVVTYGGHVVKTPYFTSSNGRTKTAAEAKWIVNDFPFTKSVEDPWSCGYTSAAIGRHVICPENAKGHGVGASGAGMTGLANEGKTAQQILDYFFADVKIEKVW